MSIFQHRHYAAIAKVISGLPDTPERRDFIGRLVEMFRADNADFQAQRFMSAAVGHPINGRDKR